MSTTILDEPESESKIRIHFFKNESILAELSDTAQCVIEQFCATKECQNLDKAKNVISVWAFFEKPEPTELQLRSEHILTNIRDYVKKNHNCEVRFEFKRNAYLKIDKEAALLKDIQSNSNQDNDEQSENEDLKGDEFLLEFLYENAKERFHKNYYPFDKFDLIDLLLIEAKIEKKDFKSQLVNHILSSEISSHYKMARRFKMLFYKFFNEIGFKSTKKSENIIELYQDYLKICRRVECYGGFVFKGQIERSLVTSLTQFISRDTNVVLIINERGVHVINVEIPVSSLTKFVLN